MPGRGAPCARLRRWRPRRAAPGWIRAWPTSSSRCQRPISASLYLLWITSPCSVRAQLAGHRARRLRQDGVEAGAAAASHRAAAAVEQAQAHVARRIRPPARVRPGTATSSRSGSRRPCCCRNSPALPCCARFTRSRISAGRARPLMAAPRCRSGMVSNSGTTMRPSSSWIGAAGAIRPASFCSTITSSRSLSVSVWDTMVWRTACASAPGRPRRRAGQLAGGVLAVRDPRRGQRARLRQLGAQQRHARVLVQRQVVQRLALVLRAGAGEQFGQRALVHVGTLAQVHRGEVKAKYFHRLLQPGQAQHDGRAVVGGQRLGRPAPGRRRRPRGRHRPGPPRCCGGPGSGGQDLGGGGQAGVHADQRARGRARRRGAGNRRRCGRPAPAGPGRRRISSVVMDRSAPSAWTSCR